MKIELSFYISDADRSLLGEKWGLGRRATRKEVIRWAKSAIAGELVDARANRDQGMYEVPSDDK